MKKILVILLATSMLLTFGCSQKQIQYSVDVAQINNEYNFLIARYDAISDLTGEKWDIFDIQDRDKLQTIDLNVVLIKAKVNQFRSTDFYQVSPSSIGYIHTLARDSYLMAKEVYIKNKGSLSNSEIITLEMYNEQLIDLDNQISDLIENPDNQDINSVIMSILSLTGTGLKLLMPLML
jgi:hypothetical protein